jgi:hypothetical protein
MTIRPRLKAGLVISLPEAQRSDVYTRISQYASNDEQVISHLGAS